MFVVRSVVGSAFLAALLTVGTATAAAEPERGARRGFRLFAGALGAMTVNRVYCGFSFGNHCVDSAGSGALGGGFWPRGTANQYVFSTGLHAAGIIGPDGGPWAGDTVALQQWGLDKRPVSAGIYNSVNPDDADQWPDAARVPCNQLLTAGCRDPALGGAVQDAVGGLYSPLLQGRINASQGDIWKVSWDGDPTATWQGHASGLVFETRAMAWNYPAGNQDIMYVVHTVYNVTSLESADYAAVRPSMRELIEPKAVDFHALNNAAFDITLPRSGFTIDPLYLNIFADNDVAQAGLNYSSVNLPFALGDTYDHSFGRLSVWTFDPAIFGPPFFAGSGFVGLKYLRSPTGAGEIHLFTNTGGGGAPGDPQTAPQMYRYLSGELIPSDGQCNTGDPRQSHICFINNNTQGDMRLFQSSTPVSLPPGAFVSVVVAVIFAAPVAGICTPPCDIRPGDPTIMGDPVRMAAGVPDQQRLAGYLGFNDINADGRVTQDEFVVVPGSLLGKALTAQAVFDSKFLLPFAPDPPEFFLIPGRNQVTVMWRPSLSETNGDPFFQVARNATVGGSVNPLYDPNFREFDIEGYRVYRGRVDSPSSLLVIAQFDYAGTFIPDFGGQLDPSPVCAPELGVVTSCPAPYNTADFQPGVTRTVNVKYQLNQSANPLVQVKLGERTLLADGTALVFVADTGIVGTGGSCAPSLCPPLRDTGVPFFFVDHDVRNNFRYFYAVTAFDFNSWQSGPTNLESARISKPVTPTVPASNYTTGAEPGPTAMYGRGVRLDPTAPVPTIDPTTGMFSGPMPPADGWDIQIAEFISTVMPSQGTFRARLDSVRLGNAWGDPDPNVYYWTGLVNPPVTFTMATLQPSLDDPGQAFQSLTYPAAAADAALAGRYGGDGNYFLQGQVSMTQPGIYLTNGTGRASSLAFSDGSIDEALWDGSFYDGPRWFSGPGETFANPTGGFCAPNCTVTNWNNAGSVGGAVVSIHQPASYTTMNFSFREFQGALGGASRAADIEVHWAANGTVDSVIDVTHNVPVPFKAGNGTDALGGLIDAGVGLSYGFLNMASQIGGGEFNDDPSNVSVWDFACLHPFWLDTHIRAPCGRSPGAGDVPMFLEPQAALSMLGYVTTDFQSSAPARTAQGFAMYLLGNIFFFETNALPAAGEVWTMRDHVGGIYGGKGTDAAGTVVNDAGDYGFISATRPMTAAGVELEGSFSAVNQINSPTAGDIADVHPVPDPYYITNEFENSPIDNRIEFINLPQQAIIRIYSSSGVLVDMIEHDSDQAGGSASWNVRNRNNQAVASGVYFYHIEANDQRRVGRMTIVRFSQ